MKILMLGPGLSAKGGISALVNNYIDAGIQRKVGFRYISTVNGKSKICKLFNAVTALFNFLIMCPYYDIVHVHMASRNSFRRKAVLIRVAIFYGKKTVVHLHGGEFIDYYKYECNAITKRKIERVLSNVDKVIALSEEWKEMLHFHIGINNITILNNAVVIPDFIRNDYSDNNILYLGRLAKEKGVDDIIDVFAEVIKRYPQAKLVLCGCGDEKKYRKMCKERNIQHNVLFEGWVTGETKKKIFEKCSIYVLPSYHEGLPISLLEAMSYGAAVITSNVGGILSVVKNDYNGIIIRAGDKEGIECAIKRLIQDVDYKKRLANNAVIEIKRKYNIQSNLNSLIELYREILVKTDGVS